MALTWRNVDAPDFRGSIAGKTAAAQLIGNAFTGLGNSLGQFGETTQNAADANAIKSLIGISDPNQYREALKSTNFDGVSEEALGQIGARAGQLLQQAATGQRMQYDQYDQGRKVLGDVRNDAAIPGTAAYLDAANRGDEATMNQLRMNNPGLRNLDIDSQQKLDGSGRAGVAGYRAGRDSDTDFLNQRIDRAEDRAAMTASADAQANNLRGDYAGQAGDLDGLPAIIRAKALKQLDVDPYNAIAPTGVKSAGAGGGKAGAGSTSAAPLDDFSANIPYDETRNYVSNILGKAGNVQGTNAEKAAALMPYLFNQESGNRQFAEDGSVIQGPVTKSGDRAQGVGQIMPATARDPGYGVTPARDGSEAENRRVSQDYLTAMMDKYNGDPAKALAAYNAGPGTVDNWTGGSGNRAVASIGSAAARANPNNYDETGFIGSEPNPVTAAGITAANTVTTQRLAAGRANNASGNLAANLADLTPSGTVVQNLIKENPTFEPRAVMDQITQIKAKAPGMTDAQAADIIRASSTPTSTANPLSPYFSGTTNLGGDIGVNDKKRDALVDEFKSGVTTAQYVNNELVKSSATGLESAKKAADTAAQELSAAMAEMRQRPNSKGIARRIPGLQAKVNKAQEKLQFAWKNAGSVKNSEVIRSPEKKNEDMNIPDPKSLAQPDQLIVRARDFGLYD